MCFIQSEDSDCSTLTLSSGCDTVPGHQRETNNKTGHYSEWPHFHEEYDHAQDGWKDGELDTKHVSPFTPTAFQGNSGSRKVIIQKVTYTILK